MSMCFTKEVGLIIPRPQIGKLKQREATCPRSPRTQCRDQNPDLLSPSPVGAGQPCWDGCSLPRTAQGRWGTRSCDTGLCPAFAGGCASAQRLPPAGAAISFAGIPPPPGPWPVSDCSRSSFSRGAAGGRRRVPAAGAAARRRRRVPRGRGPGRFPTGGFCCFFPHPPPTSPALRRAAARRPSLQPRQPGRAVRARCCPGPATMTSGQECQDVQGSSDDVSSIEAKVESFGTREDDSAQECKSGDDSSENNSESSSESESDTEETNTRKTEANSQFRCEHVKTEHNQKEQVTPRRLPRGIFWLKLEAEGTYQCTVTGLIFDVTKAAVIKYSVLSWSKYADYVKKPWIVGGPIFDVSCDSTSVLTSIQFPHSLSLNDHESDMTFKVLHIKSTGPAFEPSVDHSMTHVKWHVSSLSPVGPVIQTQEPVQYDGAVILYKVVNNHPSLSFRVYVATNNDSFIKDISKAVKHSDKKFIKIDKPPVCQKRLQNGKRYRLISESEAEITPEEIEFVDGSLLKLKSYIEVYLEQPMEFTLSLIELESEEILWKAKLRECDWILHDQNKNEQKRNTVRNRRRKSSNSLSDEEFYNKRLKGRDISDGTKAKTTLTDQQLMTLAKKMGKDWKEIAIECLKLEMKDIQQIQAKEEEVNVHKFLMLEKWRKGEKSNGTAQNLYDSLKDHVSYEIIQILEGFLEQT
ncbi:unnamed protein product [Lepidochelys kempii]